MSVNTKMTAIADKIRSLRGVSGTMGLDAMATHLGNEITGLNAALAALTEKGGTVPDGTKVDGLAALIAAIEAGGGGGGGATVSFGSFTPSTDAKDYVVAHDLGIVPDIVFYWTDASATSANGVASSVSTVKGLVSSSTIVTAFYNGSEDRVLRAKLKELTSTSSSGMFPAYGGAIRATKSTFELCDSGDGSGLLLSSGCTYYWVAIGGLT